jgi:hypothetical protein
MDLWLVYKNSQNEQPWSSIVLDLFILAFVQGQVKASEQIVFGRLAQMESAIQPK